MLLLLFFLFITVNSCKYNNPNHEYVIVDGCPVRNEKYSATKVDEDTVCFGWKRNEECYVQSSSPSVSPSGQPSSHPTGNPTRQPSSRPMEKPSLMPSNSPSQVPSDSPSDYPTYIVTDVICT